MKLRDQTFHQAIMMDKNKKIRIKSIDEEQISNKQDFKNY